MCVCVCHVRCHVCVCVWPCHVCVYVCVCRVPCHVCVCVMCPATAMLCCAGTTFFVTTGFHGMHVALGSIWLTAALASYMR